MVGTARPTSALDVTGDSERADMGLRLIQACGCRVCLTRPRSADPLFRSRGPGLGRDHGPLHAQATQRDTDATAYQ
jgi:hypothetical protein